MIDLYEVKLVLFDDVNNPKNPVFSLKREDEAIGLVMTFLNQGYSTYVEVIYK